MRGKDLAATSLLSGLVHGLAAIGLGLLLRSAPGLHIEPPAPRPPPLHVTVETAARSRPRPSPAPGPPAMALPRPAREALPEPPRTPSRPAPPSAAPPFPPATEAAPPVAAPAAALTPQPAAAAELPAAAVEPPAAAAPEAGFDTPPAARGIIRPVYPLASRQRGEEGRVGLRAQIGPDGRVTDVLVQAPSGFPDLDRSAVAAVKSARFTPARQRGRPVSATAAMTIEFRLRE